MLDHTLTLPEDPEELRSFTARLLAEVKAQARECLKVCVSDRGHAVIRYGQASKRPVNIMAS